MLKIIIRLPLTQTWLTTCTSLREWSLPGECFSLGCSDWIVGGVQPPVHYSIPSVKSKKITLGVKLTPRIAFSGLIYVVLRVHSNICKSQIIRGNDRLTSTPLLAYLHQSTSHTPPPSYFRTSTHDGLSTKYLVTMYNKCSL